MLPSCFKVGGSLHGTCNCGLTSFGMKVMLRMRQLGMIVDLAHASLQLMSDILNLNDSHRTFPLLKSSRRFVTNSVFVGN